MTNLYVLNFLLAFAKDYQPYGALVLERICFEPADKREMLERGDFEIKIQDLANGPTAVFRYKEKLVKGNDDRPLQIAFGELFAAARDLVPNQPLVAARIEIANLKALVRQRDDLIQSLNDSRTQLQPSDQEHPTLKQWAPDAEPSRADYIGASEPEPKAKAEPFDATAVTDALWAELTTDQKKRLLAIRDDFINRIQNLIHKAEEQQSRDKGLIRTMRERGDTYKEEANRLGEQILGYERELDDLRPSAVRAKELEGKLHVSQREQARLLKAFDKLIFISGLDRTREIMITLLAHKADHGMTYYGESTTRLLNELDQLLT